MPVHLSRRVAEDGLHARVGAHEAAVPQQRDADRGVVEQLLLLADQLPQRFLSEAALADILGDPDRALGRLRGRHGLRQQPAPEFVPTSPAHAPLEIDGLAGGKSRGRDRAKVVKALAAGKENRTFLARQVGGTVAEHAGKARVAMQDATAAGE